MGSEREMPCALIVMGVSGSGKSTIGEALAARLGWRYEDGDAFHPQSNVAKMRAGQPLTDEDRWPWLRAIAAEIDRVCDGGGRIVIGCSALKRAYRDELLGGRPEARMVFLATDRDVLTRRLAARVGHFFPEQLLASQLAVLEPPGPDEHVIRVVPSDRPAGTVDAIIALLFPGGPPGREREHEAEA